MSSLEEKYYEWDGFWELEQFTTGETAKRIAVTVALVPQDARTLADVGSGTGEFGRQVIKARPDIHVHSIDRSSAALKRVTTEKSVGSVESLPLGDRSNDVVSCLQVLEHLPVPIYRKALDELARVADKYLLVSVPFEEDLRESNTQCPQCGSVFNADLHLRSYSLADLDSLFDSQGFRLRDHRYVGRREQTLGLVTYERVRGVFAPRARVFLAPSCPICGYERAEETSPAQAQPTQAAVSALRRATQAAKHAVVARLPKRRLHDYWVVGLYERKA